MDKDSSGKTKITKHGLKEVTREGWEYELTVNFEIINENHVARASKDRTGLFMNKPEFVMNGATGRKLMDWCNNGTDLDTARKEIKQCETIEGLRHIYSKYPNHQTVLMPDFMDRKDFIENVLYEIVPNSEIIEPEKLKENGIDTKAK